MTMRTSAPAGSPCWIDLWTADVDASARFYGELFGWHAEEQNPDFGGYFMFTRKGVPIAGGMGDMGDMKATNTWRTYLATADAEMTAAAITANGGTLVFPPMPVADLGVQLVFVDSVGANLGAWQPGTFPGFTVLEEHGAPSWFELHTRDYEGALAFYRSVFGWQQSAIGGSDAFRYSTMHDPGNGTEIAGIMDASSFLPAGVAAEWNVYFEVDDARASASLVEKLGGSVILAAEDTPYGVIATVADQSGAVFRLRTANR